MANALGKAVCRGWTVRETW